MNKNKTIPVAPRAIVETHCHLDYLKEHPLDVILQKCRDHNVQQMITIAVTPDNLDPIIEIANSNEFVFCTQGIHPHHAKDWSQDVKNKIIANLSQPKVLAIGETGLDYYYSKSEHSKQIEVFEEQLQIAIDYKKPVVIHTRDADADTINILKKYGPRMNQKAVLHSFTSSLELAKVALDLGFYIGVNGIVTFPKADNVRETVRYAPIEQLILETDAPFLTPAPFRGHENAPFYLPLIAQKVAEEKNLDLNHVIDQTTTNAKNLFSII